jgi:hypothetical protein
LQSGSLFAPIILKVYRQDQHLTNSNILAKKAMHP